MRQLCLIILSLLLITGCKTQLLQSETVEVFKEGIKPTRPYEKVKGLTNVNWSSREADAVNYFIRKAERLGADAVLILPKENAGFKVYPFAKIGYKYRYKAVAIKWKNPEK